METRNRPDAEFKTLVIRMLSELKGRVEELRTVTKRQKI